jgi:hypothetical protein
MEWAVSGIGYTEIAEHPVVRDDDWVRLVPMSGPELAQTGSVGGPVLDERGRPKSRLGQLLVDRKLVADFDVMDEIPAAPQILVSERLVAALTAEGVPRWSAEIVSHVTPNAVSGHRIYGLSLDSWVGPFVETRIEYSQPNPTFPDEQPNGLPQDPVSFDGSRGTGGELSWSSWCGIRKSSWRALICRGSLFRRLTARLGQLRCEVELVKVKNWKPSGTAAEVGRITRDDPPPQEWTNETVLSRISEGAATFSHAMQSSTATQDLESSLRRLGIGPAGAVAHTLAAVIDARLFGGRLLIFTPSRDGSTRPKGVGAPLECYAFNEGAVPFAQTADGVLWAIMPNGIVRGFGYEGGIYGPDAAPTSWLGDQVADLEYASLNRKSRWADRVLNGLGAPR